MRSTLTVGLIAAVLLSGCTATPPLTPDPTQTPTSTERAEVVTPDELLVDVEVSPACLENIRSAQGPVESDGVEAMFRAVVAACATPGSSSAPFVS